jgi:hypothetical protein
MSILNLAGAPDDPIERLIWLSGVKEQVTRELDHEFRLAYFWCRFTGRLDEAMKLDLHSHRRVLGFTRAENEARGRMIRWGDGKS